MRVFVSRHLLNENDVNMLETIETRHFSTSNYIRSVVGEVHLLNLIIFLSICLILDISIHGRKNENLCNQNFVYQFHPTYYFLQVWKNLFIVLKIRSPAKLTCIFVNRDETRKSLRVVSLSASSVIVYCL